MMNMFLIVYLLLNFYIYSSSAIVSQILPSVSIFEESPVSTIVVDLRPSLHTLHVHPRQASLLHSQPSQPFEYINGRIQLKSRLDREDYVRKHLCLGGNVLECNFTLTLTVNLNQAPFNYILSQPISCHDINDMIPKFSQNEAKIFMAENVPIGHRIPLETASDLDSPPYGIDVYRLETINSYEQNEFEIIYDNQSRELELIVKQRLDREKMEKYFFKLLAIDRGSPANIGAQILTVEITDINDSRPRFESSVYNITVAENTIPEYLLKLHAIDLDIGINSELVYTLEYDYESLFRLDQTMGILTLTQALDYESKKFYQLKVDVHDRGLNSLSDTCTINIYVLDQNDHPPSIQMKFNSLLEHTGNMAYVKESFDINLPLVFVTVHDQDSGDHGRAQLTVEPHRLFYLENLRSNYYAVKSTRPFDRETMSFYQIELRARDFGQPSLRRSMTFELNITDINDQIPHFKTNYTFDLIENNRIPTIIGQVQAYDLDQGINGQIFYAIVPPSSYFLITPNDGLLSTNTSFDYEVKRQYKFQVRAKDFGEPSLESFIDIQINIINVNEYSPEFEQDNYEFSILENRTVGIIGQVKAFDRDDVDRIYYALSNYEDLFRIDQEGWLSTEFIFDREMQEDYKLTVIATDNSTIGSTIVTIKILDINDNPPVFLWPDTTEIRHILSDDHSKRLDPSSSSSQFITDIVIEDRDLGNNSFVILTNSNTELFYIGINNSLWLKNISISSGTYETELQAKNLRYITKKKLQIVIYQRNPLGFNLFKHMSKTLKKFPFSLIIIFVFLLVSLSTFVIIYSYCSKKNFYGSRLIVNDEEKSSHHGVGIEKTDYAVYPKQRKNSQRTISGTSPSTTDGEFSSSLLSSPFNGLSSSTSDLERTHRQHQNVSSSTVSALTTLTRKSPRRPQTKNVSFQPSNQISNDLLQKSSSTFGTLPKSTKRDMNDQSDFPTLQTILNPQPPPLLNGILLLDKMLTKSTGEKTNGWHNNVTSNYQTRASVV